MPAAQWQTVATDDGESLRAWVAGPPDGAPILLVSGSASDGRSWRFVVPELTDVDIEREHAASPSLAARHRVAGYDQRGTGGSTGAVPPDSSELGGAHASVVGRALLGPRFHLVGHSMGGMAALRLALAHPEWVASLVLVSTSAGGAALTLPDDDWLASLDPPAGADPREQGRRNLALSVGAGFPDRHPDLFEHLVTGMVGAPSSPASMSALAGTFLTHDVTAELQGVGAPTLVICGTEDRVMPPPNSRYLADHLPGAVLVEIEGAGHALDLEVPGRLADEIGRHVAAHPLTV